MPRRDLIVIIIAGVCGIVVFVVIMGLLKKPPQKTVVPMVRCLTATQPILKDQEITEYTAALVKQVESTNIGNYFVSQSDITGYVAAEDIARDALIMRSSVRKKPAPIQAAPVPKKPASVPMPVGLRAVGVIPAQVENFPQELSAGDYVDVLGPTKAPDGTTEIKTITKLVLVSGAYPVSDDDTTIRKITLAVKPRAFDEVDAALRQGKIRLMPRPDGASIAATTGQIEIIRGIAREKNLQGAAASSGNTNPMFTKEK